MVPGERVLAEIDPWYVQILEARPQNSQKIREPEQLSNLDGILTELHLTKRHADILLSINPFFEWEAKFEEGLAQKNVLKLQRRWKINILNLLFSVRVSMELIKLKKDL